MTPEIVAEVPMSEEFAPMELYALARFGHWGELKAAPAPPTEWRYARGVWRYGRGMAAAATGNLPAAEAELAKLRTIAAEPALAAMVYASGATPSALLSIGAKVLAARIAGESNRWDVAVALLREAVAMQDALPYTEPPPWYFPNREALGYALLKAGKPGEAAAVYREQLQHTPRNGWSLYGLAQSLVAQGDVAAAQAVRKQFAEVWRNADVTLPDASVF
jgi:tetratricopeptide (TPR) repeat protein